MIAGLLKDRIEIHSPLIVRDEYGNQKTTYQFKTSTRAKIDHVKGERAEENEEIVYIYNKTFQVRYYVNVGDFDRIKWNGKFYRILNIEPNADRQELIIETQLINE